MLAEESLQIFRELGDQGGMGYGFVRLGEIATALGRHGLALQCYERSLAIAEEIGDAGMKIETLWGKGTLSLALGQREQAKELFVESAAITAREMEVSMSYWPRSLTGLGHAALALGEAQEARKRFYEALERAIKAERLHLVASAVMGLANLLSTEGHLQQAAELATLILEHPAARQIDKDRAQTLLAELASQLSSKVLAAATAWGQARDLEMVAAEILSGHRNAHCTTAIAGPEDFKGPEPHKPHGGLFRED
jgi:tetratricopeptide (TPR) repeat protein